MHAISVVVLVIVVRGSVGVTVGRSGRGLLGGGHDRGRGVGHGGHLHRHHGAGRVASRHTQHKNKKTRRSRVTNDHSFEQGDSETLVRLAHVECLQNFSLIYTVIPFGDSTTMKTDRSNCEHR